MNICKKIFCRIYQTAFHLALPILPYREPEVMHSVQEVPTILKKHSCTTVLLVTDGFLRKSGLTAGLEKML